MKQRIQRQRFLPQKHRDLEYEGYTLTTNVKKQKARVLLKENERFDRDIVWCQKNKQHSFTSCYHNWSSLCFTKRGLPFVFAPKILTTDYPACGADGRSGGRCTVTQLPNFLGRVVYHIFLTMVPRYARFTSESSAMNRLNLFDTKFVFRFPLCKDTSVSLGTKPAATIALREGNELGLLAWWPRH